MVLHLPPGWGINESQSRYGYWQVRHIEIEAVSFAKGWTQTGLTQNQALIFALRCAWAYAVEVDGVTCPFEFRGAGDFGPGS